MNVQEFEHNIKNNDVSISWLSLWGNGVVFEHEYRYTCRDGRYLRRYYRDCIEDKDDVKKFSNILEMFDDIRLNEPNEDNWMWSKYSQPKDESDDFIELDDLPEGLQ